MPCPLPPHRDLIGKLGPEQDQRLGIEAAILDKAERKRIHARAANAAAGTLAKAVPDRLIHPVEANELFLRASDEEAANLRAQGADFYEWGPGQIRFVTSWDSDAQAVDRLATALAAL